MTTKPQVIEAESLRSSGGGTPLFEGADHGGVAVSFFLVNAAPGGGPDLHHHAYEEVFVVHEGEATFTVGDDSLVAAAGQIVVAPAGRPHRFVNSGSGPLRMTTIHPRPRVETDWESGSA